MEDAPMSRNPPPKPKRTAPPPLADDDTYSDAEYNVSPARRGRNTRAERSDSPPQTPTYPAVRSNKLSIVDAEAETTIGAAVKMKGELSFERLLRIEGEFEGRLVSKGSLVVGSKGALIGNIENMKEVHVTGGKIIGNVSVDRLVLRDKAQVFGNITAKTIKVDPDCVIIGRLNVNPQAPERINEKGEIVKEEPPPPVATQHAAGAGAAPAVVPTAPGAVGAPAAAPRPPGK